MSRAAAQLVTNYPVVFARTIPAGGASAVLVKFPFTRSTLPYNIEGATATLHVTGVETTPSSASNQNVIDVEAVLAKHASATVDAVPEQKPEPITETAPAPKSPTGRSLTFADQVERTRSGPKYFADQVNHVYHAMDCPVATTQHLPQVTEAAIVVAGPAPHSCVKTKLRHLR